MIITSPKIIEMINSPARTIKGRVEIYKGSTLALTLNREDILRDFTVTRAGEEGKFFGFGVSQQLKLHILDPQRALTIDKDDSFKALLGIDDEFISPYPIFDKPEITRDENTNEITVTAYDLINRAKGITIADVNLSVRSTIADFAAACAQALGAVGVELEGFSSEDTPFNLSSGAANFDSNDTVRSALNAIAEVTQTIYFINHSGYLVFKRLNKNDNPVFSITKSKYFELKTKEARVLNKLVHATELGDTLETSGGEGDVQIIRDNPFWTLLLSTEVAAQLEAAIASVGGLSIAPFECKWRGDFRLEVGDKVEIITKDNNSVVSYVLDDVTEYTGALSCQSKWAYKENSDETPSNPTTLGEVLNQTIARVDKTKQEIELVASKTDTNGAAISALQMNTDSISASVRELENNVDGRLDSMGENIDSLAKEVSVKMDAESVQVIIQTELAAGIDNVTTREKKYTLNDSGLNIADSDSDVSTRIDHDGMRIKAQRMRDGTAAEEEVLVANNQGVKAENLHATTYLIIGVNSRFEDYDNGQRTGCFWIGG